MYVCNLSLLIAGIPISSSSRRKSLPQIRKASLLKSGFQFIFPSARKAMDVGMPVKQSQASDTIPVMWKRNMTVNACKFT